MNISVLIYQKLCNPFLSSKQYLQTKDGAVKKQLQKSRDSLKTVRLGF